MVKTEIIDPIAIEELLWVKKDGEEIFITAKVGRPYKIDNQVWACPAELIGVDNKYPDIHGDGSMQALSLAKGLIKTRLGHLLEDGEKLYHLDEQKSELDKGCLDAIFCK